MLPLNMLTYTTKLIAPPEDLASLRQVLEWERDMFNRASKEQFPEKKRSIVVLHRKVYRNARQEMPQIPAQVIIRAIQSCLSAYRSSKSNEHTIKCPIRKKRLSLRLDHNLYSKTSKRLAVANKTSIKVTTSAGRKTFAFTLYPKLQAMLESGPYKDPLIFERDGELHIALTFDAAFKEPMEQRLALGIDLGCRVPAATSDGRLLIDKKYAKEKRRLRFLKRQLQSARDLGSRSAKRHLKKIRRKEFNKSRSQTHLLANAILQTDADTIVLENLKSIKVKKHKGQNKNRISQVPLYDLRRIITYKAGHMGKHVMLVCPSYTSQTDCLTGKREGERRGRRFYAKSGLIYNADINAAVNIVKLSKLPYSGPCKRLLAGQAPVSVPIVDGSHSQAFGH